MDIPDRLWTIDFETTGLDPKTCHPVEVALYKPNLPWERLIKPPIPIPPETSAIHHITDEDVVDAMDWPHVKDTTWAAIEGTPLPILVAHNAAYEKDVLRQFTPVIWICTYKCALRVWPDAPAHKNEVLRYWLKLGDNLGRRGSQAAHSALHDCKVTYLILQKLLEHATIEQLVEWTEQPAQLPKMPLGKHFGQKWDTIPAPYLDWIVKQVDMREDVKACAQSELSRRKSNYATHRSS